MEEKAVTIDGADAARWAVAEYSKLTAEERRELEKKVPFQETMLILCMMRMSGGKES